jgi:hypothetical protein
MLIDRTFYTYLNKFGIILPDGRQSLCAVGFYLLKKLPYV